MPQKNIFCGIENGIQTPVGLKCTCHGIKFSLDTGNLLSAGKNGNLTGNYGVWQLIQTDGRHRNAI